MLTKHEGHECKECKEKLPSFMKLLKHVADYHYKDEEHEQVKTSEDDVLQNIMSKDHFKDEEKQKSNSEED